MGSDQSAVRLLPCHDLTADCSLPISVLDATGRGCARTAHALIRQLANSIYLFTFYLKKNPHCYFIQFGLSKLSAVVIASLNDF